MLQCVAVCCSVAVCAEVAALPLQQIAQQIPMPVLQCVAVCCSVLQCAAVCCSVALLPLQQNAQQILMLVPISASYHMYERVMSHVRMRHVTRTNESYHSPSHPG